MTNGEKLWPVFFKPTSFENVQEQEQIVSRLKHFIRVKEYPNMLFVGPSGVGKTSCVNLLLNSIFSTSEDRKKHILRINGANDRGHSMVRDLVKPFCKKGKKSSDKMQFIVIESVDQVIPEAQQMLPYMIDRYSNSNRFILTAINRSKILNHLKSHCMDFIFKPLEEKTIIKRLNELTEIKNLSIAEDANIAIARAVRGDMRKAIYFLQSASALAESNLISSEVISEISNQITKNEVNTLLLACFQKKEDFSSIQNHLLTFMDKYGFLGEDVVNELYLALSHGISEKITPEQRYMALSFLAETEYHISNGCNPVIQIIGFFSKLLTS